jgi:hypothetical protein
MGRMPYTNNFKEFQMKAKYLVLWGALAAFIWLGCKDPTEVVIVKGERISAPKNLMVNFHDSPTTDYIQVSFTPSSSAIKHTFYASHFNNKMLPYTVTASLSSGGYNNGDTLTYEIQKSAFKEGFYGGSIGGGGGLGPSYWYLQSTLYIGVTSTSYANVPSDMAWSKNLHTGGSSSNPGTTQFDPAGNWSFVISGQNVTVNIYGSSWTMTGGGYNLSGYYTSSGNNMGYLYSNSNGSDYIGTAYMTSNSSMTLVIENNSSGLPSATYYGTRFGY